MTDNEKNEKRLTRERQRVEILERLLEDKSRELYFKNKQLEAAAEQLEEKVKERTAELENEISVRSELQELFAEQKARLETILQSLASGVLVLRENRIILSNARAREILNFNDIAKENPHFETLVTDIRFLSLWQEHLASKDRTFTGEWVQGGDIDRVIEVRKTLISVGAENIGDAQVLVLRDITHQKELEQMKNDFISSVSHELRTPLTSIKGFTLSIVRDPEMPADTRQEFLNIVLAETERLASLIADVLEISRMDSGEMKLNITEFAIGSLLSSVYGSLSLQIEERSLQFDMTIPEDLPLVCADSEKSQIIFLNLVSNAIKYTEEGGTVSVIAEAEDDFVSVSISDTGLGIPSEDLDQIFNRFFRVHRPGTEIAGTGLGLAIVKDIVELQGGTVGVESEFGKGSVFTVRLPKVF